MPTPVTDLIYGALAEIRVARGGDVVRAEDQALCLTFLNEVLERLAATANGVYARVPTSAVLTPGTALQTIGPTGSLIVAPRRPPKVLQVILVLGGSTRPPPLTPHSADWWGRYGGLTSGQPTDFHYNPVWPNGELGLAPTPTQAHTLAVVLWAEILAVADTDVIDLPQGYSELLRLWTAKKAAPSFAREFSSASQAALTECLAEVFGSNITRVNDADTRDGGVPGGRGGTYDYRTGLVS